MERKNLDPKIWGPHLWKTMYFIGDGYPENPSELEQGSALDFFESLKLLIPCETCRENYENILTNSPPDIRSKKLLLTWINKIHNIINQELNKEIVNIENVIEGKPKTLNRILIPDIPRNYFNHPQVSGFGISKPVGKKTGGRVIKECNCYKKK